MPPLDAAARSHPFTVIAQTRLEIVRGGIERIPVTIMLRHRLSPAFARPEPDWGLRRDSPGS